MKLIGLTGAARCGKDTAADFIIGGPHDFVKMSFADPMKEMLATGLGLNYGQLYGAEKEAVDARYGRSPRYILQTLGTEWGRNMISDDIWLKATVSRVMKSSHAGVVIPDVRFDNEADYLRRNGALIHVSSSERGLVMEHESERGVKKKHGDFFIYNDGSLEDLQDSVEETLKLINAFKTGE